MCTVSFVATNEGIVITSNRDEKVVRLGAIEPRMYVINNKNVLFPKDQKAGGTWYVTSEDGNVVVLLNGALEKHQIKESYKKSRGLIVLELISSESLLDEWEVLDLNDIEPFTLVVYFKFELYQMRWNGIEKELIRLNASTNYIWSSSTLYSNEIRMKRAQWFTEFLNSSEQIDAKALFNFHRYTEESNADFGLVINRDNSLKTLSITQSIITKEEVKLLYADLLNQRDYLTSYTIN